MSSFQGHVYMYTIMAVRTVCEALFYVYMYPSEVVQSVGSIHFVSIRQYINNVVYVRAATSMYIHCVW